MAICVNSCRNVRRDRRYMDQLMRGPRNTIPPPTPRDYTLREDFKIGKVVLQDIPAMAFDRGCCEWNPGGGYVTIYDESADPTGAMSAYDVLAVPAPTTASATVSGDHTVLLNLTAHIYDSGGGDLGTVTITGASLNGGNTDLTWSPAVSGAPTGGQVVIFCDGGDPQEGGICFNPRGATRVAYQVYNFTCLPMRIGQKVYLHREFVQGTWIAMPMDPPGRIRIRLTEDIPPVDPGECSGPWDVELLDYEFDEMQNCSLVNCEDSEMNPITVQVYSDLCMEAKDGTDWEAEPYEDCDGCLRYWILDSFPQLIHGINPLSIAAFDGTKWKAGSIDLKDVQDDGTEIDLGETATVWNGCPFDIDPNSRIKAEKKDCKYLIISVCCPVV